MNLSALGNRIRTRRLRMGFTQSQLADVLHCSPQAVSKLERGENAPDISILPQLATRLDVSLEWLLTGSERLEQAFEATVFLSDFRKDLYKPQSPRDWAITINGIHAQITEVALASGGVPIKYLGDGFICYFAGPNHAQRALEAAQRAPEIVSRPGLFTVLNSGLVYLGSVGHPDYARIDMIGHVVDLAFYTNVWVLAHPEETSKVFVTQATYEQLNAPVIGKEISSDTEEHPLHFYALANQDGAPQ